MPEINEIELEVSASGTDEVAEQLHEIRDAANEAADAIERLNNALDTIGDSDDPTKRQAISPSQREVRAMFDVSKSTAAQLIEHATNKRSDECADGEHYWQQRASGVGEWTRECLNCGKED
jgi:methyl-accepting chemotaxis protein